MVAAEVQYSTVCERVNADGHLDPPDSPFRVPCFPRFSRLFPLPHGNILNENT
jgi:hypothetical protein